MSNVLDHTEPQCRLCKKLFFDADILSLRNTPYKMFITYLHVFKFEKTPCERFYLYKENTFKATECFILVGSAIFGATLNLVTRVGLP